MNILAEAIVIIGLMFGISAVAEIHRLYMNRKSLNWDAKLKVHLAVHIFGAIFAAISAAFTIWAAILLVEKLFPGRSGAQVAVQASPPPAASGPSSAPPGTVPFAPQTLTAASNGSSGSDITQPVVPEDGTSSTPTASTPAAREEATSALRPGPPPPMISQEEFWGKRVQSWKAKFDSRDDDIYHVFEVIEDCYPIESNLWTPEIIRVASNALAPAHMQYFAIQNVVEYGSAFWYCREYTDFSVRDIPPPPNNGGQPAQATVYTLPVPLKKVGDTYQIVSSKSDGPVTATGQRVSIVETVRGDIPIWTDDVIIIPPVAHWSTVQGMMAGR